MTEEKKKSLHPISEVLFSAYESLLEKEEVSFPLHERQKRNIDSVVKTVNAEYFGITRFSTEERRAAAYFCLIIKTHPVTDGNKRLAVFWLEIFSRAMKLAISLPRGLALDQLAVSVEKEKSMDNDTLIEKVEQILFD